MRLLIRRRRNFLSRIYYDELYVSAAHYIMLSYNRSFFGGATVVLYSKVVFARKTSASDRFIHGTDLFNAVIYRDFSVLHDLIWNINLERNVLFYLYIFLFSLTATYNIVDFSLRILSLHPPSLQIQKIYPPKWTHKFNVYIYGVFKCICLCVKWQRSNSVQNRCSCIHTFGEYCNRINQDGVKTYT